MYCVCDLNIDFLRHHGAWIGNYKYPWKRVGSCRSFTEQSASPDLPYFLGDPCILLTEHEYGYNAYLELIQCRACARTKDAPVLAMQTMLLHIEHSDGVVRPRLLWSVCFDDGAEKFFCVLDCRGRVDGPEEYVICGAQDPQSKLRFQAAEESLRMPTLYSGEVLHQANPIAESEEVPAQDGASTPSQGIVMQQGLMPQAVANVGENQGETRLLVGGHETALDQQSDRINAHDSALANWAQREPTSQDWELIISRKFMLILRMVMKQGTLWELQFLRGKSSQAAWTREREECETLEAGLLILDMQINELRRTVN